MKKLLLLIFLLIPLTAYSGVVTSGVVLNGISTESSGGEAVAECPTGSLVCQNFEGAGYDNSESWVEYVGTNGIVDEDDTTATVLKGLQQIKLYAGDSGQTSNTYIQYTAKSEVWFHVRVKFTDATPSNSTYAILLTNGVSSPAWLSLLTTGKVRAYQGTVYSAGSATLANDTAYHVWGYYKASEAGQNNGIFTLWIGTTTTRPETADCSVTTGTSEADVSRFQLQEKYQGTAYFDQVIVDDAEFTTVAE